MAATGPYTNVQVWLGSTLISNSTAGAIALTSSNTDSSVNFAGFNSLSLGAVRAATYGGTLNPGNNGDFLGGGGGTLTFTTSLTGANSLTAGDGGGGNVILTNGNSYTGATTISAGTLQLGNGTSGNDGSLTATSGITDNSVLAYNLFGSQTASYNIGGSGSLTKAGTGTLILTNADTYTGPTTVSAGTLQLGIGEQPGPTARSPPVELPTIAHSSTTSPAARPVATISAARATWCWPAAAD